MYRRDGFSPSSASIRKRRVGAEGSRYEAFTHTLVALSVGVKVVGQVRTVILGEELTPVEVVGVLVAERPSQRDDAIEGHFLSQRRAE